MTIGILGSSVTDYSCFDYQKNKFSKLEKNSYMWSYIIKIN